MGKGRSSEEKVGKSVTSSPARTEPFPLATQMVLITWSRQPMGLRVGMDVPQRSGAGRFPRDWQQAAGSKILPNPPVPREKPDIAGFGELNQYQTLILVFNDNIHIGKRKMVRSG